MALVVMVVYGSDGDVLPFLHVGSALRARGHEVSLISHEYFGHAAVRAGLDFFPFDTCADYERHMVETANGTYDTEELFEQFRLECDQMRRRYRPGRTIFVGASISSYSVLTAAELLGAPAVCLTVAPYCRQVLPELAVAYQHSIGPGIDAARAELGLAPVDDWASWLAATVPHIGLWPRWFDRAGTGAPPDTRLTGFVLPPESQGPAEELPAEAAALLAGEVRPVLLTGGTGRFLAADYYQQALAGAAALDRPVLLAVRHRDLLPERLPPNVHWFPRLPFPAILPEVVAIVHHGGIGTISLALAARTPQVLLGSGVDRPDNGERLSRHGTGRVPPRRTVDRRGDRGGHPHGDPPWLPVAPAEDGGSGAETAAIAVEQALATAAPNSVVTPGNACHHDSRTAQVPGKGQRAPQAQRIQPDE